MFKTFISKCLEDDTNIDKLINDDIVYVSDLKDINIGLFFRWTSKKGIECIYHCRSSNKSWRLLQIGFENKNNIIAWNNKLDWLVLYNVETRQLLKWNDPSYDFVMKYNFVWFWRRRIVEFNESDGK